MHDMETVPDQAAVACDPPRPRRARVQPIKVAVLVHLPRTVESGGHVKCWERLAAAAKDFDGLLDLSVFFCGGKEGATVARNVRFVIEKPIVGTARIPVLRFLVDHTDLAPYNPRLARALASTEVLHTADGFSTFARTALRVARRRGLPLVNSVHTDVAGCARVYTRRIIDRVAPSWTAAMLDRRLGLPDRVARGLAGQLARHQEAADFVLVSRPGDIGALAAVKPRNRIGFLRRGVDGRQFDPAKRDRAWLAAEYGVPEDRLVVLFVGRVDDSKNVALLAEAAERAIGVGRQVHVVFAGPGAERAAMTARLGGHANCTGAVEPERLARIYASADLFASASEIEEHANVVQEAQMSGLPALVAAAGGMGRAIRPGETGLVLDGRDAGAWAAAVSDLAADPERRAAMGRAARAHALRAYPSWSEVLAEDLLPVWRAAAERGGARLAPPP
jgi:glycosyltransferase involved in cell wall biosynthesis